MKNYKLVNVATKSGGSTGTQILIGRIDKIDAQGVPNGFLNNVKLSLMVSEAESDAGAMMAYLSTDDAWNDDHVISAGATGAVGGIINLAAKRPITTNAVPDNYNDLALGTGGPIYLWVEMADYVAAETFRYVAETWGRYVEFTEI
jgi:hypothetical protein